MPHVEQELTLPRHLNSSSPVSSGVLFAWSLVFCVVFCRSLFILLSIFLSAIVLSVFLRFTDSDYPFGISKFFLLTSYKLHTTTKNLWYKIITHRLVKSNKELYQTQYYTTKARRQVLPPVQVWLETITGRENMLEYYLKPLSQSIPLQKNFKNFRIWVEISFICGEKRSTQRKPLTCHKSLTNFIT